MRSPFLYDEWVARNEQGRLYDFFLLPSEMQNTIVLTVNLKKKAERLQFRRVGVCHYSSCALHLTH